jgi:beta-lactamase superfamily II metal-dependent hydrolase
MMMKRSLRTCTTALVAVTTALVAVLSVSACASIPDPLNIYFVDVEGGQATLIVTPSGETLLIDTGYPGKGKADPTPGDASVARDAQRILAAATDANVSQIDYLLITHFHGDHFGGTMELSELIPIGTIVDHGTEVEEEHGSPNTLDLIRGYKKVREQHSYLKPVVGDKLPLQGVDATIVSSAGSVLKATVRNSKAVHPACDRLEFTPSGSIVNMGSTGVLIRYGEFHFLDVGDLVGQPLSDLVCPSNRIGPVDVYLVSHHGAADAADPATFAVWHPRVAILNNGPEKGGSASMFDALRNAEGLEDVWQLHVSEAENAENFSATQIVNLDAQTHDWLKLSAYADGSFRILNGRTGEWKSYAAK